MEAAFLWGLKAYRLVFAPLICTRITGLNFLNVLKLLNGLKLLAGLKFFACLGRLIYHYSSRRSR